MNKYLTIAGLAGFALCVSGLYFGVHAIQNAAFRAGQLDAKNAQVNQRLDSAMIVMEKRNDIDTELMQSAPDILGNDDGSVTGAAVGKWMYVPEPKHKP